MKFSNGCWQNNEGTEVFSPAEIYFTKIEEEQRLQIDNQYS